MNKISDESQVIDLDFVSVDETAIKLNLEIADRYQAFSAELLRLSLLGIAGIGFLVVNLILKDPGGASRLSVKLPITISLVSLGLSALCALINRYFLIDTIDNQLKITRALKERFKSDSELIKKYCGLKRFHSDYAYWILWASVGFLAIGAFSLAASFITWL